MNRLPKHPLTAALSPSSSQSAGAVLPLLAAPAFSLTKLLEDARRFERDPSNEGELSYLLNIADNLLRARPGMYAEEALRSFKADLECALENEAADRAFVQVERLPNGGIAV